MSNYAGLQKSRKARYMMTSMDSGEIILATNEAREYNDFIEITSAKAKKANAKRIKKSKTESESEE